MIQSQEKETNVLENRLSNRPLKVNVSVLFFWLLVVILFFNAFAPFKVANLHWWIMYLSMFSFFGIWVATRLEGRFATSFRIEILLVTFFVFFGIISLVLNQANWADGFFVIGQRVTSLLILGFAFFFAWNSESLQEFFKRNGSIFNAILRSYFVILVLLGSFQSLIQGKSGDILASLTNHAHKFSLLLILLHTYFILFAKRKWLYIGLIPFSLYLIVKADFKMGILSFILAITVSWFILQYQQKGFPIKKFLYLMVGMTMGIVILLNVEGKFNFIQFLSYIFNNLSEVFDVRTAFPPNLELFKGYYQLFSGVLNSTADYLFGVGPGNYGSNVAVSKEKPLAQEFVIYYRDILDKNRIIRGTLLTRVNAIINIIAEFGFVGFVLYFLALYRLVIYPLSKESFKVLASNPIIRKRLLFYLIVMLMTLVQLPFYSTIEQGIYMSLLALTGMWLILYVKKEEGLYIK